MRSIKRMEVMAAKHKDQKWQLIASFALGVACLAIMLAIAFITKNPTELQVFVFRIVISVGVGGIAAVLPGGLTIKIPPSIHACGAVGLVVLVYMVNPPNLIGPNSEPNSVFEDYVRRAEAALVDQDYNLAINFFDKAKDVRPDSWIPVQWSWTGLLQKRRTCPCVTKIPEGVRIARSNGRCTSVRSIFCSGCYGTV